MSGPTAETSLGNNSTDGSRTWNPIQAPLALGARGELRECCGERGAAVGAPEARHKGTAQPFFPVDMALKQSPMKQ